MVMGMKTCQRASGEAQRNPMRERPHNTVPAGKNGSTFSQGLKLSRVSNWPT